MGNGNGRSDLLYALVDDVTDLKGKAARADERLVLLEQRLDRIDENTAQTRRMLSDVVVVVQGIADKLVSMDEKLNNHERRLVRIEEEHGYRLARIEDLLTKKGWKH